MDEEYVTNICRETIMLKTALGVLPEFWQKELRIGTF
jgi:hypothetical protein